MVDAMLVRTGARKRKRWWKKALERDAYLTPTDGEWYRRIFSDPWWGFVSWATDIGLWEVTEKGGYYRDGRFGPLLPGND